MKRLVFIGSDHRYMNIYLLTQMTYALAALLVVNTTAKDAADLLEFKIKPFFAVY
jgi:tRNA A22 N-methylase